MVGADYQKQRDLRFSRAAICIYYHWQNKGINIIAGKKKHSLMVKQAKKQRKRDEKKILLKQMYGFYKRHEQGSLPVTSTLANHGDSGCQ